MDKTSDLFKVITPVVVSNGQFFINDLFNKKFNGNAPNYAHHLVAFYKNKMGQFLPVSYTHFLPYKNVILVGGAMTDGNVIKQMTDKELDIISSSEGIYFNMLKFAFEYFANQCDAFFGHVDDPRALEVDLAAGFENTEHEYLIAHFHKPLSNWKKNKLIKTVHKLGNF